MSRFYTFLASAALGLSIASAAMADDTRLPSTGSAQGLIVPNALPGGGPPHTARPEGHLIAPSGAVPQTGSAQSVQPPGSLPTVSGRFGEAQPHTDVTSPRGIVPLTGSAQGAQPPASR